MRFLSLKYLSIMILLANFCYASDDDAERAVGGTAIAASGGHARGGDAYIIHNHIYDATHHHPALANHAGNGLSLTSDPEDIFRYIRNNRRLPPAISSEASLINQIGRLPDDIKRILHR